MKLMTMAGVSLLGALSAADMRRTGSLGNRPQAVRVRDNTPHKVHFVKVAPGVELEVLDWGGKGNAMVLLAGWRR